MKISKLEIKYPNSFTESDDDNTDLIVEYDGQIYLFVAFTPKNIVRMMEENYPEDKNWVIDGMMIVRRMSEDCIIDALEHMVEMGIERFGIVQVNEI